MSVYATQGGGQLRPVPLSASVAEPQAAPDWERIAVGAHASGLYALPASHIAAADGAPALAATQARLPALPSSRGGLLALSAPAPHDSGAVHARPAPPPLQLVDVAQHRPMEYPWLPALTVAGADAAPEPGAQGSRPVLPAPSAFPMSAVLMAAAAGAVGAGALTLARGRAYSTPPAAAAAGAAPPPVAPAAGFEAAPSKRRNKPRRKPRGRAADAAAGFGGAGAGDSSEEEREMNGVAAAEQDVSVATPASDPVSDAAADFAGDVADAAPAAPAAAPATPVPEPPPPLTMPPLPAGAFRVGRLQVGPAVLGYGSGCTVVFEGLLEGRPVAVKRLLAHFHELAKKARPHRRAAALSLGSPQLTLLRSGACGAHRLRCAPRRAALLCHGRGRALRVRCAGALRVHPRGPVWCVPCLQRRLCCCADIASRAA